MFNILISNVMIKIGAVNIYWYSFFIFMALLVGGSLSLKEAKKWNLSEDFMINMFFFAIPISIIGARLYYVIFNWSYYSDNLLEILEIWKGGLGIHGGIFAGLIFVAIYTARYKVNFLKMTDILVVGLIIGQAIGRWGNFFNQEAHGGVTTLEFLKHIIPFDFIVQGMNINGIYYQPTFLYESVWCLIGFIILILVRRMKYIKTGQITSLYFIWYGIGRFFIEGMRTDSLMLGNLRMAQVVSLIFVVVGIILFILKNRGFKLEGRYNTKENDKAIHF